MREAQIFFCFASPPLGAPRGRGQNLNCNSKLSFLDTLKLHNVTKHKQSYYLTMTTLSLIQTKLAEKPAN